MGTWKSYINVDHIAKERWSPPLVVADWHAFCQALYKKSIARRRLGESLYDAYKEMSSTVGVEKPQEAKKGKSPLENEGSQGCGRKILRSSA